MFKLLIPCFGDQSENLPKLLRSIDSQKTEFEVESFFLEDEVSKNFRKDLENGLSATGHKFLVENNYGRRLFALFNICRFLDSVNFNNEKEKDVIIGIIDGDDFLWGNDCIQNVKNEYDKGHGIVWTANEWDKFGLNHSGPYEDTIKDPYSHPWVSSHFKTFKLSDYKKIPQANFKNKEGKWFEACYDQALMLPLLHIVLNSGNSTKYINKSHYIYRGDIKEDSEFREKQLNYESYIRTRGYLK